MKIDHIGYAVKRIDRALKSFESLGFVFGPVIDDVDRNVSLAFGEKDGYRIELVATLDKKKDSPVTEILANSFGTPYHICYESDNFDKDIQNMKMFMGGGCKIVVEPAPAVAFNGRRVIFLMNMGFGLMEIVEK